MAAGDANGSRPDRGRTPFPVRHRPLIHPDDAFVRRGRYNPRMPERTAHDADDVVDHVRYRLDDEVDLYLSEAGASERMIASLRIEPMRVARLRTLERTGAAWLPDVDGALVHVAADADRRGADALTELLCAACEDRGARLDEPAWLARCPWPLLPLLHALGWRDWPVARSASHGADVPIVLLLDDVAHLRRQGSPLAGALSARTPRIERAEALLAALADGSVTAAARPAVVAGAN